MNYTPRRTKDQWQLILDDYLSGGLTIKNYCDPGDIRKGADGLAALVSVEMNLQPCTAAVFVFINRGRNKLKMLFWENNAFVGPIGLAVNP